MPQFIYAQLNGDGIVVCESVHAEEIDEPHMVAIPQADGTYLRKRYAGGQFVAVPQPSLVPASVDMAQARLTLHQHGLLEDVEALIAAMPEPQKSAAQIEWEFRPRVRRYSALVQYMIQHLPLTEQQADQLFIEAATK